MDARVYSTLNGISDFAGRVYLLAVSAKQNLVFPTAIYYKQGSVGGLYLDNDDGDHNLTYRVQILTDDPKSFDGLERKVREAVLDEFSVSDFSALGDAIEEDVFVRVLSFTIRRQEE